MGRSHLRERERERAGAVLFTWVDRSNKHIQSLFNVAEREGKICFLSSNVEGQGRERGDRSRPSVLATTALLSFFALCLLVLIRRPYLLSLSLSLPARVELNLPFKKKTLGINGEK